MGAVIGTAWPSTHYRELHAVDTAPPRNLPPLDVRSPEFIEQRLENLKRRPSWIAWLDQYVLEHPESDSDDESSSAQPRRVEIDHTARPTLVRRRAAHHDSGFVATTLWSLLVVAFTPLLLLLAPCLRRRDNWPLGCTSVLGLIAYAYTTLASLLLGAALVYYALCRELPELRAESSSATVVVRLREMQQAAAVCAAAIQQREPTLAQELCAPLAVDTGLVVASTALVLTNHRTWAKRALLCLAVLFAFDAPAMLRRAVLPAPVISRVDPSYALVDEEVVVALDGQHLKPGGSVAWVAFWGCASTSPVESCEKQFASVFGNGVVRVTFSARDHFIPCYRAPPNPLKSQDYVCFPDVRLRVKDRESIPGWSRGAAAATATVVPDQHQHHDQNQNQNQRIADTLRVKAKATKVKVAKTKTADDVWTVRVAADGAAALEG